MITRKDRQNGSDNHEINTRHGKPKERGGMLQLKSAKGGMPQYDDSQRSRNRLSSEKVHKNPDKPKDGGMPQCEIE